MIISQKKILIISIELNNFIVLILTCPWREKSLFWLSLQNHNMSRAHVCLYFSICSCYNFQPPECTDIKIWSALFNFFCVEFFGILVNFLLKWMVKVEYIFFFMINMCFINSKFIHNILMSLLIMFYSNGTIVH